MNPEWYFASAQKSIPLVPAVAPTASDPLEELSRLLSARRFILNRSNGDYPEDYHLLKQHSHGNEKRDNNFRKSLIN